MIVTRPKNHASVVAILRSMGATKLFLVGCGSCATITETGGEEQIAAAALAFEEEGFTIVGRLCGETACHVPGMKAALRKHPEAKEADAFVLYACGAGVQTVAEIVKQPVIPALDSAFLGSVIHHGVYKERCRTCGDCVLAFTAGICPVTQCPKGLLNGPCGGMWEGMCEVFPDRPCIHVTILEKLKEQKRLRDTPLPPKNYGAHVHPEIRS